MIKCLFSQHPLIQRHISIFLFSLSTLSLTLSTASAESQPLHLPLQRVLTSVSLHMPQILEAQKKRQQEEANYLSSKGAFDLQLQQKSRIRTSGYYDGYSLSNSISKPLRPLNSRLFAEYRYSDGEFPVYEDELITLNGGEINIGLALSLLRNRSMDERRLTLLQNQLDIDIAKLRELITLNEVQLQAITSYLEWLKAHRQLDIYQQLLQNVEDREAVIIRRVKLGDLAKIELLDVKNNLLKRNAQVNAARNAILSASVKLSLYWRDDQGHPVTPDLNWAPENPLPLVAQLSLNLDQRLQSALENNPELIVIDRMITQTQNKNQFLENQLLPKTDLSIKAAQDIGTSSNGFDNETREGFESSITLDFSLPLEQRKIKGKKAANTAKLKALTYTKQRMMESFLAQLEQSKIEVTNAKEQVDIAKELVKNAQMLFSTERRRYLEGDSNILFLNVREENTAEANIKLIADEIQYLKSNFALLGYTYDMSELIEAL